jgi:hypothetical protein
VEKVLNNKRKINFLAGKMEVANEGARKRGKTLAIETEKQRNRERERDRRGKCAVKRKVKNRMVQYILTNELNFHSYLVEGFMPFSCPYGEYCHACCAQHQ